MSVLDRSELAASPLADLHLIASELGMDGFRRLRKEELIDAILTRQGGSSEAGSSSSAEASGEEEPRRPRRRGGRRRRPTGADSEAPVETGASDPEDPEEAPAADDASESTPARGRSRGGRGGRGRSRGAEEAGGESASSEASEERAVKGTVELLANGSGFVRVSPPDPSDEDVYVSAAQIRRCELVSGDEVSGPVRSPRRSERYASLVRVDTINGAPADEVADGPRFDDLPAAFADERLALGSEDPTVKAIEWLTPFGKGSRVLIVGSSRAGKTEALRRIARALSEQQGLELSVALVGVRPEELADWAPEGVEPMAAISFAASPDAQGQALERVLEPARRVAARGGDAVLLIDTLAHLPLAAARKALAAARSIAGGGSLTIIATAPEPLGGESTVIALDAELAGTRRFPALDLTASGTIRPELLVGEAGAEAIASARAEAAD